MSDADVFDFQNNWARLRGLAGEQICNFASDHLLDRFDLGCSPCLERADRRAVSQHGDPIADRKDFIEFVRDVDAGDASITKIPQDIQQDQDFVLGKSSRWLIQNENPGILRKRLYDLDELLLADSELRHGKAWIDIDLELLQKQPRFAMDFGPINQSPRSARF